MAPSTQPSPTRNKDLTKGFCIFFSTSVFEKRPLATPSFPAGEIKSFGPLAISRQAGPLQPEPLNDSGSRLSFGLYRWEGPST